MTCFQVHRSFLLLKSSVDALYYTFSLLTLYSSALAFLFGSFFMIAISLLNLSLCSCIIFLILLNCLSVFSCSSLHFLKTTISNSLSSKLQIFISLDLLLGNYCIPLVVSCSLDFSCSLKSCITFFTFE